MPIKVLQIGKLDNMNGHCIMLDGLVKKSENVGFKYSACTDVKNFKI